MSSFVLTPLAIFLTKTATDDKGFSISFDRITAIINYFFPAKKEDDADDSESLQTNEEPSIIEIDYGKTIRKQAILENVDFEQVKKLYHQYKIYSTIALVSYLILLGLTIAIGKPEGLLTVLPTLVVAIVFYITLYKSQQQLNKISIMVGNTVDLNTYIVLFAGYPFYILFYFYNRSYIKEVLTELNKTADGQY